MKKEIKEKIEDWEKELEERIKIYRELEDKLIKIGQEMGRKEESLDWIIAVNHLLKQATKYNWGQKYIDALEDIKKRMKITGIENLFIN